MKYLKVECNVPEEYVAAIVTALNDGKLIQAGADDFCFAYASVKGRILLLGKLAR